MRGRFTSAALLLASLALLSACTSRPEKQAGEANDAGRTAADQKQAARAEAMGAIQALEGAIEDARRRVAAAAAPGGATTREQRLALSETRRAIVVANVSLQKARTAYAGGDFGAARDATAGVADRLEAAGRSKPATSLPPAAPGRR